MMEMTRKHLLCLTILTALSPVLATQSYAQLHLEIVKAAEEAATKKAEAKKIASDAKRQFTERVTRAWNRPQDSTGKKATARVTLSDSGAVQSVVVNASDSDMKASIEAAVREAAPYPMPSDPDARREARTFTSSFTAK